MFNYIGNYVDSIGKCLIKSCFVVLSFKPNFFFVFTYVISNLVIFLILILCTDIGHVIAIDIKLVTVGLIMNFEVD